MQDSKRSLKIRVLGTWEALLSCSTLALGAGLLSDCSVGAKVAEDPESTRITQGFQNTESGLIPMSKEAIS